MEQLTLFAQVAHAYENASGALSQESLYDILASQGLSRAELERKALVGRASQPVALTKRRIRWMQQTLRAAGVIERVEGEGNRGLWQMTEAARAGRPRKIQSGTFVLGFSTRLGLAVIADCRDFFSRIDTPINLILTSPPYPLSNPRAYGNVKESEYVDWLCDTLGPAIKLMAPGASLCLNVGNDVFLSGLPARSTYQERLVLALCDRFGLYKMDGLVWSSNKAPGPAQWASRTRVQLNTGYEMVYWFTNDPKKVQSNNQRVLEAHSAKHLAFVRSGGTKKAAKQSDGAYYKKVGSYGRETAGRIPTNVLYRVRSSADRDRAYREYCEREGLVRHGASMPVSLADTLVKFTTKAGDLVVDPMAGRCKPGMAAENNNRRWLCTDIMADHILGAKAQFF